MPASPMRGRPALIAASSPTERDYAPEMSVGTTSRPPKWIKPQLTRLVDEAPTGDGWLHEIKYDGYRMHARIDGGKASLLARTGLNWSHRYERTIASLGASMVGDDPSTPLEVHMFNIERVGATLRTWRH